SLASSSTRFMSVTRQRSPSQVMGACSCPETASSSSGRSVGSSTSMLAAWVKSASTVPVAVGSPSPSKLVSSTSTTPSPRYPPCSCSTSAMTSKDTHTWQSGSSDSYHREVSPVVIMYV